MKARKKRVLLLALLAAVLVAFPHVAFADEAVEESDDVSMFNTSLSQVGESTSLLIENESTSELVDNEIADTMRVNASMSYKGEVTRSVSSQAQLTSLVDGSLTVNLNDYGPFDVTIDYLKQGNLVSTKTYSVGISASEYNLAPLSASFPVVLYSLSFWDISTSASGVEIPSIVMLDRPSAYNWDSLPSGMYALPYLSAEQNKTTSSWSAFADYVKALYEINPNSKFNLYINDITCSLVHRMIYANRIPEGNYSIRLLSDGTATYVFTNESFEVADPVSKNHQLIESWNTAKEEEYRTGVVSDDYSGYHDHWDSMYALLSIEPGTEWWMTRTNLFKSGDGNVFADSIATNSGVKKVNVASMLKSVSSKGDQTVQELKALYNFNDGYFSDAQKQDKKAMMLLGTYVYLEQDFEEYAALTKTMYGDDYLYYYKGHPNTPTALWPEKQDQLDLMDISDVDSSVAAELILFFNPNLNLSGYSSSTYNSTGAEAAGGLWGQSKSEALSPENSVDYSIMKWFATPINNEKNTSYKSFCSPGESCYLVEFSDAILQTANYDFAIYSYTRNAIYYYKEKADGGYRLVATKLGDSTCKWIVDSARGWVPYVNGTAVKNGWVHDGDSWYLMQNGFMQTGWGQKDGNWYYFNSSGAMQRGWQFINGTWYLLGANGAMRTGWCQADGNWYLLGFDGGMKTGWAYLGSTWYWLKGDGSMATGWENIGGNWYYFNSDGSMQTSWVSVEGDWYYFSSSGAMQVGWLDDRGSRYYMGFDGAMRVGWFEDGNTWYFLNSAGAMQTGWQLINSKWYFFSASGSMAFSRWVGDYYLLENGSMAADQWIGPYYVGPDGKWAA